MRQYRILVVEDEALIAIDLGQQLLNAGFEVVGPALTVSKALALVGEVGCDAAVLDVNLGSGTAEPIARELIERSIPFVVVSGYARIQHPPIFLGRPNLVKPVRPELLVAELERFFQNETKGGPRPREPA